MEEGILDQEHIDPKNKALFKTRPVIIWGIVLILGILFRIMHWPFAQVLILIPTAGLQAYCINGFIKPKERNALNTALSLFGILWLMTLIGGMLFNNGYPYNEKGLKAYVVVFIIYFIIYYFIDRAKEKRLNTTINE